MSRQSAEMEEVIRNYIRHQELASNRDEFLSRPTLPLAKEDERLEQLGLWR